MAHGVVDPSPPRRRPAPPSSPPGAPRTLSDVSRALTALCGVLSAVTGALLFLAPGWAAPRFAWSVTSLMVMSIGGWFVGNAVWAVRLVRGWTWARHGGGLVYLWSFGLLQTVVLVAYRDRVVTDTVVAVAYLVTIGALALAGLVGVLDLARLRPSRRGPGRPMPPLHRGLVVAFVAFVTFLFAVAMLRPGAATGQGVFPEDMSPFTVRSFGVYFLALVLGALVLLRRDTLEPVLEHAAGGLGVTLAVLVAAVVHLDVFALQEHPLQWIYLGAYVLVLVIGVPLLVHGRRRDGSGRAADR